MMLVKLLKTRSSVSFAQLILEKICYNVPMDNNAQTDSVFANWLIKKGVVKSEAGANAIMIAFIIFGFAFTFYMMAKQF